MEGGAARGPICQEIFTGRLWQRFSRSLGSFVSSGGSPLRRSRSVTVRVRPSVRPLQSEYTSSLAIVVVRESDAMCRGGGHADDCPLASGRSIGQWARGQQDMDRSRRYDILWMKVDQPSLSLSLSLSLFPLLSCSLVAAAQTSSSSYLRMRGRPLGSLGADHERRRLTGRPTHKRTDRQKRVYLQGPLLNAAKEESYEQREGKGRLDDRVILLYIQ